jgi:hypothetical protein
LISTAHKLISTSQIDLAVSLLELDGIQDLVNGTIFKIKLENHVFGMGRN